MIHMLVIANRLSQTQENMDLEICKPENGYKNTIFTVWMLLLFLIVIY